VIERAAEKGLANRACRRAGAGQPDALLLRDEKSEVLSSSSLPAGTVLTIEEEAVIVAFRKHTLLPLDDCL